MTPSSNGIVSNNAAPMSADDWADFLKKMPAIYGNKFAGAAGTPKYKETTTQWASVFKSVGISYANVLLGIEACARRVGDATEDKDRWPPTPIEFLTLCRPQCDTPDIIDAYHNAISGRANHHPHTWYALNGLRHNGLFVHSIAYEIRTLPSDKAMSLLQSNLNKIHLAVKKGYELPAIPKPIPPARRITIQINTQSALEKIQMLKDMLKHEQQTT